MTCTLCPSPSSVACSCGIALCSPCAAASLEVCPRCHLPWIAPVPSILLLRDIAAVMAVHGTVWDRAAREPIWLAHDLGIPREAIRAAVRRGKARWTRAHHLLLEHQATSQAAQASGREHLAATYGAL